MRGIFAPAPVGVYTYTCICACVFFRASYSDAESNKFCVIFDDLSGLSVVTSLARSRRRTGPASRTGNLYYHRIMLALLTGTASRREMPQKSRAASYGARVREPRRAVVAARP